MDTLKPGDIVYRVTEDGSCYKMQVEYITVKDLIHLRLTTDFNDWFSFDVSYADIDFAVGIATPILSDQTFFVDEGRANHLSKELRSIHGNLGYIQPAG